MTGKYISRNFAIVQCTDYHKKHCPYPEFRQEGYYSAQELQLRFFLDDSIYILRALKQ